MQRRSATLSYLVLFPRNIRLLPRAISQNFRGFNKGLTGWGSKSRQTCMVSQMLQNSTTCTFYSTSHIYVQRDIFIFNITYLYLTMRIFFQLQPKVFSLNKNIRSTWTKIIFVQLQPELFSVNNNNYSTSKMHCLSNRPHFRWVYRRDKPRGMLGEHEKSL